MKDTQKQLWFEQNLSSLFDRALEIKQVLSDCIPDVMSDTCYPSFFTISRYRSTSIGALSEHESVLY